MQKYNYAERLKTEMDNGSSGMSESITESKKRFYEEEFFIRKWKLVVGDFLSFFYYFFY